MFGWLLLHVIIGAFYRPIRQGRKVAYLTLVSFVFLVIALVGMFVTSKHGGAAEGNAEEERLQIANCKLQIANCSGSPDKGRNDGRNATRWTAVPTPESAGALSPQFAICNLQFAICNSSFCRGPAGGLS